MTMTHPQDLHPFFYPRDVAVIGVSSDPNNLARNIVRNLLLYGFEGEILSVGRRGGVLFGQRIYRSVEEIGRAVDLAVILTPAKTIPQILEQCGQQGIRHAIVESGGFSELGPAGIPLEKACLETAAKYGMRFIGPNGIATICLEHHLTLPFVPIPTDLPRGPVSILSQSGGVGLSYLGFLSEENIGLNKFVSMGNKLNVDENDLLEYLIEDEGTKIILLYLEGFKDGRRFLEIVSRSPKPILVQKSNRFKASAQIAHSHTAALFADDVLVDHALEQAGCVRVNTLADAIDYLKILTLPPLEGNRLAVVSRSGGHAVIAADACDYYGFDLPRFPKEFLESIEKRFRANVIHLQNPLDMGDLFELDLYEHIVEEMLKRDDVDGVLLGHGYQRGVEQEPSRAMLHKVAELVPRYNKPVALVIFTDDRERDYLKKHIQIPIFTAPENAMRAFHLSHRWSSRRVVSLKASPLKGIRTQAAREVVAAAGTRPYLHLDESLRLIQAYGIAVPPYRLADSAEAAVEAWRAFKGPVAMKINRPHVSHKSDRGLVQVRLDSARDIRKSFKQFRETLGERRIQVLVQPVVEDGREVILGGKQDGVFGPVVLFGLGGVLVEALGDVTWRVAPLRLKDALHTIQQIRGRALLKGVRGQPAADVHALADNLVRVSHLLVDLPMICEIDINPVRVGPTGRGCQALDARVALAGF